MIINYKSLVMRHYHIAIDCNYMYTTCNCNEICNCTRTFCRTLHRKRQGVLYAGEGGVQSPFLTLCDRANGTRRLLLLLSDDNECN